MNGITPKMTVRRQQMIVVGFIVLLASMQLFLALLTNGFAMSQDEAMWHYIGRNWFRNGLVPYSGGVDNHSPLVFAIFGLSDKLFGVNYWFPRLVGTVCQSVGIYYLYKIAKRIMGWRAGILAMSFYGLSVLWHGADGKYVSFTETYDVMFIIMSFYYFVTSKNKKGYFISGFLSVIGTGFRLSGFFGIVTLFITSFKHHRTCTYMFCLGVLSGVIFLSLIFLLAGIDFRDIYTYAFADNFVPGSTTDHDIWFRAVHFCEMFFYSEVILFYPLILTYFFIRKKVDWLILWLIFEFIGINIIGNYARVDLKDIFPPMALIGALVVAHLISIHKIPMKYVMTVVWICFSPKLVEPFINFQRLFKGEYQFAANFCHEPYITPDESACRQLGWWVKANTNAQDKVLVAGFGSQVQVYSERQSPSIYFNATQTRLAKERFFKDMRQNEPEMILIPLFSDYRQYIDAGLQTFIDQLVEKDYDFDQCMFNYNIYRINKKRIASH